MGSEEASNSNADGDSGELSVMSGGWCGVCERPPIPPNAARKVQHFLQSGISILRLDEIINKKDAQQVAYVLEQMGAHNTAIQVAFLQGATPLQQPMLFAKLLEFLHTKMLWCVNLGEMQFTEAQAQSLSVALKTSGVTHMCAAWHCTPSPPSILSNHHLS